MMFHRKNVKTVIKMHRRATVYVTCVAERTSSSVRSLFSKGTGLWREGACCVAVCMCVWTYAQCVFVCVCVSVSMQADESVGRAGGNPYHDTWIESLKPKQTVANSPAAWPLLQIVNVQRQDYRLSRPQSTHFIPCFLYTRQQSQFH